MRRSSSSWRSLPLLRSQCRRIWIAKPRRQHQQEALGQGGQIQGQDGGGQGHGGLGQPPVAQFHQPGDPGVVEDEGVMGADQDALALIRQLADESQQLPRELAIQVGGRLVGDDDAPGR